MNLPLACKQLFSRKVRANGHRSLPPLAWLPSPNARDTRPAKAERTTRWREKRRRSFCLSRTRASPHARTGNSWPQRPAAPSGKGKERAASRAWAWPARVSRKIRARLLVGRLRSVCECVGGQRGTLQGIFLRRADPRAGTDDASVLILSAAFCHGGVRFALSTRRRRMHETTWADVRWCDPVFCFYICDTILGIRDRVSFVSLPKQSPLQASLHSRRSRQTLLITAHLRSKALLHELN
jgi:hypothetical protein